jgi:hypothetical protein
MGFLRKMRNAAQGAVGAVIPRPGGDIGGVPARGVIVEVIQGPFSGRDGEYTLWNGVTVSARLATDPADTPPMVIECYMKSHAWRDLEPGRDVPVRVDAQSGALIGLDCEAYETEVDERPPIEIEIPSMEPEAGALAPIEGVSLEQWAAVQAGIAKNAIAPADYESFASSQGVPAGRWAAISSEWQSRASSDWKVGSKFGAAYQAAMTR